MNDYFYKKWLKKNFKDLRKKKALEWFNETYFVAMYDLEDNFIDYCEDIESFSKTFNIPVKKLLQIIRTDTCIVLNHQKCKLYLVRK